MFGCPLLWFAYYEFANNSLYFNKISHLYFHVVFLFFLSHVLGSHALWVCMFSVMSHLLGSPLCCTFWFGPYVSYVMVLRGSSTSLISMNRICLLCFYSVLCFSELGWCVHVIGHWLFGFLSYKVYCVWKEVQTTSYVMVLIWTTIILSLHCRLCLCYSVLFFCFLSLALAYCSFLSWK